MSLHVVRSASLRSELRRAAAPPPTSYNQPAVTLWPLTNRQATVTLWPLTNIAFTCYANTPLGYSYLRLFQNFHRRSVYSSKLLPNLAMFLVFGKIDKCGASIPNCWDQSVWPSNNDAIVNFLNKFVKVLTLYFLLNFPFASWDI